MQVQNLRQCTCIAQLDMKWHWTIKVAILFFQSPKTFVHKEIYHQNEAQMFQRLAG